MARNSGSSSREQEEEEEEQGDVVVVHMVDIGNSTSGTNTTSLRKAGLKPLLFHRTVPFFEPRVLIVIRTIMNLTFKLL
jgi:hypothetical protein